MPKKKRFIILFSVLIVMIFSTAATCNLCGTPVTIEDEQVDTVEQSGDDTDQTQDDDGNPPPDVDQDTDDDTGGDDTGDDTDGDEPVDDAGSDGEENNPPEIISIFLGDEDMTDFLSSETLPERYEENTHNITVVAEDPDGDEMDFDIAATQGEIADIARVAVDSVAFNWISPANTEDSETPLDVDIVVTVTDPNGGEDSFTINIALLPVMEALEEDLTFVDADPSLSGYITADTEARTGMIIVGDRSNDRQVKGYLSFDLSFFDSYENVIIEDVVLIIDHINQTGDPSGFASSIDFKVFDYGNSLDMADFRVGGSPIFTAGIVTFTDSFGMSSSSLLREFRDAIDSGKDKFQIKLGLNGTTDGDGDDDFYQFHADVVSLDVAFVHN